MKTGYDSKTAVTFLLIGLGAGALLSLILRPKNSHHVPVRKSDQQTNSGPGRMSA